MMKYRHIGTEEHVIGLGVEARDARMSRAMRTPTISIAQIVGLDILITSSKHMVSAMDGERVVRDGQVDSTGMSSWTIEI